MNTGNLVNHHIFDNDTIFNQHINTVSRFNGLAIILNRQCYQGVLSDMQCGVVTPDGRRFPFPRGIRL